MSKMAVKPFLGADAKGPISKNMRLRLISGKTIEESLHVRYAFVLP